jgi:hypothetical protein
MVLESDALIEEIFTVIPSTALPEEKSGKPISPERGLHLLQRLMGEGRQKEPSSFTLLPAEK